MCCKPFGHIAKTFPYLVEQAGHYCRKKNVNCSAQTKNSKYV